MFLTPLVDDLKEHPGFYSSILFIISSFYLPLKFLVAYTLPNAVDTLLKNIDQELIDSFKKVMKTTSWILQCYRLYTEILDPIFVIRINFGSVTIKKLNDYKTVLVFYLQYQKNLEYVNTSIIHIK